MSSSTGFGRALAEAVLAKGDRVAATARKIEQVADLELWYHDRARAVCLEVTDLQTVTAVEAAVKAFSRMKEVAGFGI